MGLGIMGTMEMARNAMRVARSGAEVSGNNLANAANPAYARQRIKLNSSVTIPTEKGPQGSGAEVARLESIRDKVLDKSIISEKSISQYLDSKQVYLRRAEANLGQTIDSRSIDSGGGAHGISEGMTELFNSFQSLSVSPTSTAERQIVVFNAQKIADKFNTIDRRLSDLRTGINAEVEDLVTSVNSKLKAVANIAINLGNIEIVEGSANEVRDSLQSSLEELAEFVNISTATNDDGELNVFIDGVQMITDNIMTNSVGLHTDINGMHTMAEQVAGNVMNLKSGYLKGLIDARDTSIVDLQTKINTLATQLITEVNTLHRSGYDLNGNTGQDLFTGTGAADVGVNTNIVSDPRQLQGSSSASESSNNDVIRSIAALSTTTLAGLNGMTFSEHYGNTISRFGQEISLTTAQLDDQKAVQKMLEKQRESIMGVSVDEEVANLVVYQRAFQASAKLLTTMDSLMKDVLNLTR
ncbi:MAG: flagellar hook-associated protein FlgK [Verrucomicrobiota bacterium]|nr:flagellar hook-associated protein FlgK [Verrucomicrobiota bacterium]